MPILADSTDPSNDSSDPGCTKAEALFGIVGRHRFENVLGVIEDSQSHLMAFIDYQMMGRHLNRPTQLFS